MTAAAAVILVQMLPMAVVAAEDAGTGTSKPTKPVWDAKEHLQDDWGSYYDPQNVFCGKYDCYKILGFDYESFGSQPPSTSNITKRYRGLSREWHPDKNKGNKDAKEKFVKLARAYEVLTDKKIRKEYDALRYDQETYMHKYGTGVLWQYAPKSDTTAIVVFLLVLGSIFTWYAQKSKWQTIADKLVQAAVEDWGQRDGGTAESKELRQRALVIVEERKAAAAAAAADTNMTNDSTHSTTSTASNKKSGSKKNKLSGKEKKQQLENELRPVCMELVTEEHDDFGGGFHKPTWKDLLVVKLVRMPLYILSGITWNTKYLARRLLKKELNDEEREVLTRRAVGEVTWAATSDKEHESMVTLDLWNSENLEEWREEQEVKRLNLSAGKQKKYNRWKKGGFKQHDE
jgi:DnaJ family protein C protein 25